MKKCVFEFEKLKENLDHVQTDIYKKPTSTDNAVCNMLDHRLALTIDTMKYVAHTTHSTLQD
jgi:hypothetical protein